jgi:Ser/Thr protein kinase RdoA (MazF antagonist)
VGVADEIAAAFALGRGPQLTGATARGEQGRISELRTATGRYAVKETFEPLSDAEAEDVAAFQEAAIRAGVPAPAIVRTTAGAAQAALEDGRTVRVYGWVELRPPDRTVDAGEVGTLLGRLHAAGHRGAAGEDPWYTDPVGAGRWAELADALAAAGGPFARELAALVPELVALEALLAPPRTLATCHRDLWADNLLPTRTGGLCAIDWDNAGLAGPEQELAMLAVEFAADDPARVAALVDAYAAAGGPGRVTRPGDFSLAIAQLGHIGEMAVATWLDPAEPEEERRRQVPRIEEFVTLAVTRATIDRMFAALGEGRRAT